MKLYNYHTHTCFSDGRNTPEEIVQEAVRLGFEKLGISDHSYLNYDVPFCMAYTKYDEYKSELKRLKEAYQDKIEILTGIEQDYYSDYPAEGFDYIIGSAHSIEVEGEQIILDYNGEHGVEVVKEAAGRYFGGDILSVFERYYENLANVVEVTNCDIIGHFDIIAKSKEMLAQFDREDPRYIRAWKKAADILLTKGKPFEINVAPVIRGSRPFPHPAPDILEYLKEHGARFVYSGDCHSVASLAKFAAYMKTEYLQKHSDILE